SKLKELLLEKEKEITNIKNNKEMEILKLQSLIDNYEKDKALEINKFAIEKEKELAEKEKQITELTGQLKTNETENLLKEQSLKEQYEAKLRFKDEEIAHYKDFKARLSTKMIGESLEQHCEIEFNRIRPTGFQNAYFEKDNDAKTGSKG